MDDQARRREARRFVDGLRAAHAGEEVDETLAWTIVTVDLELGTVSYHGIIPDPIDAMRAAAACKASLYRGHPEDEPGWDVSIAPILPLDERSTWEDAASDEIERNRLGLAVAQDTRLTLSYRGIVAWVVVAAGVVCVGYGSYRLGVSLFEALL